MCVQLCRKTNMQLCPICPMYVYVYTMQYIPFALYTSYSQLPSLLHSPYAIFPSIHSLYAVFSIP